ncbi:undecaprenyl-diphosphate phosphatase [Actinotignum timonense]|uniref:undecaprenyl-diphosphate phosphatase n=1 Tax=Actinotignum timonense TaxID=1870995 RepID=UPI002A7EAE4D|nr:undecaprenyl-diphosphate phosphatase [Actinotignum timonense]MDY5155772.1 undecaprenyl-diphosphate phosphatase [Actinotignum timonense]
MGYLEAAILGIVQALTEFLPISSSAHIRIIGDLFGWGDPGAAFTAIIQLGTEAAVLCYFWKDIVRIIRKWLCSWTGRVARTDADVRMGWVVIIGTLPIGILGLLFADTIETSLRNLYITAAVLALFAIFLGVADRWASQRKDLRDMSYRDGLLLGFGQALALIPGVSRSGGTITTGLLLGYTREAAARVSFLMAVPAVLLSGFYQLVKYAGDASIPAGPTILATAISFVLGYAVIVWFLRLVSTRSYLPFVIYRLVLAALVVVLLGTGVLSVF